MRILIQKIIEVIKEFDWKEPDYRVSLILSIIALVISFIGLLR